MDTAIIDTNAILGVLPTYWSVERDGESIYGYATEEAAAEPRDVPASFTLEPQGGGVYEIQWCRPNPLRGGLHEPQHWFSGGAEQCLEHLEEMAREAREEVDP